MPSPFPGMNPYLERESVWSDFHGGFLQAAKAWLNLQVGPHYYAKTGEHIFIEDEETGTRRVAAIADISVTTTERSAQRVPGGLALLESPARGRQPVLMEERVGFIELWDRHSQSLVTVIELLSPTNKKSGAFRNQYLAKQEQYLTSSSHLVEIDLLRRGPRMPWIGLPPCDYCAVVSHADERPEAAFWPFRVRDPFPKVPIPLKEGDAAISLDLKAILDRVYDESLYERYVYNHPPEPPLRPDDVEWARQLIAS